MCTKLLNNAGLPDTKKKLKFVKPIKMKLARASGDLIKGVNHYF